MRKKQVNLIVVGTCWGCPCRVRNSDYGMSYDTGEDCTHEDSPFNNRIANDSDFTKLNEWREKNKEQENTLFPNTDPKPKDPMSIPDWCPLEDV